MNNFLLNLTEDKSLIQGYPAMVKEKSIEIKNPLTKEKIRFELEDDEFIECKEDIDIPDKVQEIMDNNEDIFDDYEIYKPEHVKRDPFLFGIKNNKKYFILAWELDEWMIK